MKNISTTAATAVALFCSLGHLAVAWTTPSTAAVACGRASGSLPWRRQSRFLHKRKSISARDTCLRASTSTSTSASNSNSHSSSVPLSIALSPAGDWPPRGQQRSLRQQLPAGRTQTRLCATTSTATAGGGGGLESENDADRLEIAGDTGDKETIGTRG
ncbi:unnamed protein product, partial [Laminaria digitata]